MNSTSNKILIINVGIGNIQSVVNSIEYLGYSCVVGNTVSQIEESQIFLLPGVGAFGPAMKKLKTLGLADALKKRIEKPNVYILGICLGMQLLFEESSEHGYHKGLGLIQGKVEAMSYAKCLPHVGWNNVRFLNDDVLFNYMTDCKDFYFDHSYRVICDSKMVTSDVLYEGEHIVSSVRNGNVFGVQFHPEKSQFLGLKLIKNFLDTGLQ